MIKIAMSFQIHLTDIGLGYFTMSASRRWDDWWIAKDLEERGFGLIDVFRYLSGETRENNEKF
jgi:hypothetical protein